MIKSITFLFLSGFTLSLGASVPVPENLPNPFEIPDPTGFRTNAKLGGGEKNTAEAARSAAFEKIKDKFYALPVRGIVSEMRKGSGGTTILLGPYTLREGSTIPSSDFEIKGIIRVASVSPDKIVIKVSIELETKEITIPLAR